MNKQLDWIDYDPKKHRRLKRAVFQAEQNYAKCAKQHRGQARAAQILQTCMTALLRYENPPTPRDEGRAAA